jgi:hypothetical protein
VIFATPKAFAPFGTGRTRVAVTEATRRLADAAGQHVPASCTVVVLRTTGVLGLTVRDEHAPDEHAAPVEEEDGERVGALAVLLAHSATALSWLGGAPPL